ncbi:MAG: hypothetical protein IJE46_02565 [Clostridia bacterium]|nr:hypothetical protein [Clostridia bacterium]
MVLNSLTKVNEYVSLGQQQELVLLCETRHKQEIDNIYKKIIEKGSHVILVTGPSSSGKTTFSNVLSNKFEVPPLVLSVDNFFYGGDEIDKTDSNYETFESIAGVNVELLNECIYSLLRYEPTNVPRFDFTANRNIKNDRVVTLRQGQEIILEGTHAFNEVFVPKLDGKEKFKAFIYVGEDFDLGGGEVLTGRDIRLIRRSVRDQLYRGSKVDRTQTLWGNVVRFEKDFIMPYLESADSVFNTFLAYEPCIMKTYLDAFLRECSDLNYTKYIRSLNEKISEFKAIDEGLIPKESLLKEFIRR